MSPAETWLLVAAIVAGVAALAALLGSAIGPRTVGPGLLDPLARALTAAAVGLVAVGLLIALP